MLKTRWLLPVWGLCVLLLALQPAGAARVTQLYEARLEVAEQQLQLPTPLAAQALGEVLVRVSGRTQVLGRPAIEAALARPGDLVDQFSYRKSGTTAEDAEGFEVPTLELRVDFVPTLVDELLEQAGVRPLGPVRPGVLVWLVEEQQLERRFLGGEADPVLAPMIRRARERGLPLYRPLLDLQDRAALSVADVWGFFVEPVMAASARYQADAVLLGRLHGGQDKPGSEWLLLRAGQQIRFQSRGDSLAEHLTGAVDITADRLFADFMLGGSSPEQSVHLRIQGVDSFSDYAGLVDYLEALEVVKGFKIDALERDQLTLGLQLAGSLEQLRAALKLNRRLQPRAALRSELASGGAVQVLRYRWGGLQ